MAKTPGISVDILVLNGSKILLGLLNKKWCEDGNQLYGVPGRDIYFREKMGATVKRNIQEEFGCNVTSYKIISVNANYAQGNHYIGIGVTAEIDGEPKLLLPEDWEKWEWFDKGDLPSNLHPATQNLIECYLEGKVNVAE
jgi:hypothetical protein